MRLVGTVLLTGTCGLVWGGLAHGLEVAHSVQFALPVGMVIGVVMGFVIQPFRDVDWPAAAAVSLIGLYIAVALFAIGYSASELTTTHQPLARWPSVMVEDASSFVAILSISGWVFFLWPFSFANHMLVWWCQRRHEASAS